MEPNSGKTNEIAVDPADAEQNKVVCALAYIWILFFLPLVVCPKSPFGRFHANQGLVLFVMSTIGTSILRLIPLIGKALAAVFGVLMVILAIMGIINALSGKAQELPGVGSIRWIR